MFWFFGLFACFRFLFGFVSCSLCFLHALALSLTGSLCFLHALALSLTGAQRTDSSFASTKKNSPKCVCTSSQQGFPLWQRRSWIQGINSNRKGKGKAKSNQQGSSSAPRGSKVSLDEIIVAGHCVSITIFRNVQMRPQEVHVRRGDMCASRQTVSKHTLSDGTQR